MNSANFLINTVFDLYLTVILLRIWLQMARADFYNPFSQFIVKATNPIVIPLRRIIPGWGGIDMASVVFAILFAGLKITVLQYMAVGAMPPFVALVITAVFTIVQKLFSLIMWALIIRAILSWISQGRSPIEMVLGQLTDPILAPIRRIIPSIGGLDLSVLIAIIGLQFIQFALQDLISMFFR